MDSPMQLCYLVPGALSAHPAGAAEAARREAYLRRHARPDTIVEIRDNPDGPASIETVEQEREAAIGLERMLPEAVSGFDAVIIGCFGDPGLAAARERVSVPVVGPAQASMHLAAQLGRRFGIITVVQDVIPVLEELATSYGLQDSLARISAVDVPVLELRERRTEVMDTLMQDAREAVGQGVDALILGCMTMGFLDVAADLQAEIGVPVVNPVLASVTTAEAISASGLVHARPEPRAS
jgi:allantoin racemase